MREALAATNHDFLLRDEDRGETQRRGRGAKDKAKANKKGALTRLFGGRRRGVVFLCLAGATAIGVPLNALYFQDGRHPAPLFRAFAPEPRAPESRAAVEAPAPLPPARPQTATAPAAQPQSIQPALVPHAAAPKPAAKPEQARGEKRDAIGALLGHKAAPKADEADKNVQAAQRALAKLGYALHADGKMGGATKQAIEKYERDNHLPVTGEVTQKLLRKLQGQASVAAH
ncbi:putative peptidoglycan binding protein [Methylosinus sp. sav-2]|uniref:peptidoglycan-binding domain-containing protein n=1 Tax=Methylosinus sp. sav-2 TaxID=2485168 RepID=UPI000689D188|nr:peptidoglycan-binding domain-containing protein [Methylosinus sp. sav-2]TDX67341.1 putative peptidoglycan binding protein [Methylosinus sp. sav-2]